MAKIYKELRDGKFGEDAIKAIEAWFLANREILSRKTGASTVRVQMQTVHFPLTTLCVVSIKTADCLDANISVPYGGIGDARDEWKASQIFENVLKIVERLPPGATSLEDECVPKSCTFMSIDDTRSLKDKVDSLTLNMESIMKVFKTATAQQSSSARTGSTRFSLLD
jgi:hypothetical protein